MAAGLPEQPEGDAKEPREIPQSTRRGSPRHDGLVNDGRDRVEALGAVTLGTTDMARSVRFYERLGFRLLYGGSGSAFSSFQVGSGYLNLQAHDAWTPPQAVWGRVIFYVDDVDAMYERAVTAGLTPANPPADAPWKERYFHIRDPDGHELSFARPLLPKSGRDHESSGSQ